ncbi:hypothetical protein GCK32_016743, partial [Trichostrongylus colubriformis]
EASTEFGIREKNNPFLYVVLPEHLRHTELYQQVLTNSEQLVTPHDLYSTLKDILYYQPSARFSDLSFKQFQGDRWGTSFLRQFKSGERRTCKNLPIPFQYCICQYQKEKVTDAKLMQDLGLFASKGLATILSSENVTSNCEKIILGNVTKTLKFVLPHKDGALLEANLYEVTFNVAPPALGTFRILIREQPRGKFEIAAEFDRLDRYGKNGDCMKKDPLRPVCTCKKSS